MIKNTLMKKILFVISMLIFCGIILINIRDLIVHYLPVYLEMINTSKNKIAFVIFLLIIVTTVIFFVIRGIHRRLSYKRFNHEKASLLRIKKTSHFIILLGLISLAIKLIFVFILDIDQYSDFQLLYWVTNDIAQHTPKYLSEHYFSLWAYQTGFPAIMSPILSIFGSKVEPLIIANCIFMSIINILVYLLSRIFVNEKVSRIFAIAYALFPLSLSLSPIYTNQHLATMFFFIGLYILLFWKSFSIMQSIIAGVCFSLGNMVRPEGIIFILSIVGYIIIVASKKGIFEKNNISMVFNRMIKPIGCTVLVFIISNFLIEQVFISSGLNPNGLSNEFPLYKFVVGLNHSTNGSYSAEDAELCQITDSSIRNKEALRLIKERIRFRPGKFVALIGSKVSTMWSSRPNSYPSFANMDYDDEIFKGIKFKYLASLFGTVDMVFLISLYLLCTSAMLFAFKSENIHRAKLLLTIIFIVTFFIYLFIEVQHRYSYIVYPALFIIASYGFEQISRHKEIK